MAKILLVAGHGQGDPGANGGGYNERDTMRQLVDKIKKLIPNDVDVYDKSKDMFQQTRAGGGMYTTGYKEIIEFHMDAAGSSATGGHVIIYKGYKPDNLDNRLANAIKNRVGWIRPNGFDGRNNLLNLNVAAQKGISYRLLELGFITNANDRKKIISEMDQTALALAEAITNKKVGGQTMKYHTQANRYYEIIEDRCVLYKKASFKERYHGYYTRGSKIWISEVKKVGGAYMGKHCSGWVSMGDRYLKPA